MSSPPLKGSDILHYAEDMTGDASVPIPFSDSSGPPGEVMHLTILCHGNTGGVDLMKCPD